MSEKLNDRFPISNEMLIATALDPRLQNLPRLISELSQKNISKFDLLKNECLKVFENIPVQVEEIEKSSSVPRSSNRNPSTIAKLIRKHAYDSAISVSSSQEYQKIDEEIHKYFLTVIANDDIEGFDILKFWNDHSKTLPSLAEVCKTFLCIPVTSTSSERAFSYAGLLINAKRSSLSPNVVERTLFIHHNYTLVKKTIFSNFISIKV